LPARAAPARRRFWNNRSRRTERRCCSTSSRPIEGEPGRSDPGAGPEGGSSGGKSEPDQVAGPCGTSSQYILSDRSDREVHGSGCRHLLLSARCRLPSAVACRDAASPTTRAAPSHRGVSPAPVQEAGQRSIDLLPLRGAGPAARPTHHAHAANRHSAGIRGGCRSCCRRPRNRWRRGRASPERNEGKGREHPECSGRCVPADEWVCIHGWTISSADAACP